MHSIHRNEEYQRQLPTLVVGATGQLGAAVVEHLRAAGRPVRALLRDLRRAAHLLRPGVTLAEGDLRDLASLRAACRGAGAVVATANMTLPRRGDRFGQDEVSGYQNLARACADAGVGRIVYSGAPHAAFDDRVPQCRIKHAVEDLLKKSGVPTTILRLPPFMDVYFPLIGSALARRNTVAGTLDRPYWFTQWMTKLTGSSLDNRGLAVLPGRGVRHAFIAVEEAALYLARAADMPGRGNLDLEVAGPEALSWEEVARLHGRILGKSVRCIALPGWLLDAERRLLGIVSPTAANVVAFLWAFGTHSVVPDGRDARRIFHVRAVTAEEFLQRKAAPDTSRSRPAHVREDQSTLAGVAS